MIEVLATVVAYGIVWFTIATAVAVLIGSIIDLAQGDRDE